MTNPKKPDFQTDDIGRDQTPTLGPEQALMMELLKPALSGRETLEVILGTVTLVTTALPTDSEWAIDHAPSFTELEGPNADYQRLSELALEALSAQAAQLAEAQAELGRVRGLKLAAEGVSELHAKGEIRGSQQGFYALMALRSALATAPAGGE